MKFIYMSMSLFCSKRRNAVTAFALTAVLSSAPAISSAQLVGAGSSLARDLMGTWSTAFAPADNSVKYEAIGSTKGVERVREGSVDFGVSDVPLTEAVLKQSNLKQIPLAGAAVAVIVNIPALKGKIIRLDGDILADIYQAKITNWNHSQILAANPDLKFPDMKIVPVSRADGSGQSYVMSSYIARGNTRWRKAIGGTSRLDLPTGTKVDGGAAMIKAIAATPGAIGYESLSAAQKAELSLVELKNASGGWIGPQANSIAEALGRAQWSKENNTVDLDGSAGAGTYPMATVIYALVPIAPKVAKPAVLAFLKDSINKGDVSVTKVGFVALPKQGKALVQAVQ
jgi:phosphate transport system substrate-binding protein